MAEIVLVASTGSKQDDDTKLSHVARLEDGRKVKVPGPKKLQRIVLDNVSYVHVGEAGDEWVYRAL